MRAHGSMAVALIALGACTDGGLVQPPPGKTPLVHRAAPTTCTSERPAYDCNLMAGGAPTDCKADAQCDDPAKGRNGRCVGNGHDGCSCSYDTCTVDADCAAGQLCDCRSDWHYGKNGPARCLPGNCRVDADCGPDGFCSPSLDPNCGSYLGVSGWYCHTKSDSCVNDSDCQAVDGGFPTPFCGYKPEAGRWMCSTSQCVG